MTESKAEFDQYRIDAGAKVAELQATAEAARAEIAASKAETAKANERTAALELARAKIEARLAPRSLTQAQQNES
jgi:outer membrane murein-binding lipoprotein Lpp